MAYTKKGIKEQLEEEEKIKIKLLAPKDAKEENFVPVCINGYIVQIKKGETAEVPKSVFNLLELGGYI